MKRSLIILIALLTGIGASAQEFNFGVKGGVAANWMPGTYLDPGDRARTNVGFYGGIVGALDFDRSIFIELEALYARRGISTSNELLGKYSRNISYIQVPVLAGFKLSDDRFRVMVGPEFGFCVGNKVKSDAIYNPASIGEVNPFNLSFVLQTTYLIVDMLGVDFKFDYGINRTMRNAKDDRGRNMSLQLGLSLYFGN